MTAPTRAAVEQAIGGAVHVASESAAATDAVMALLADDGTGRALALLDNVRWRHLSAHNRRVVTEARRVLRGDDTAREPATATVPRNGGPGQQWSPVEQRLVNAVGEEQAVELVALLGEDQALAVVEESAEHDGPAVTEPPC